MDAESQPAHDHVFGVSQWFDMGGYNPPQHSPPSDFSGYAFGSSPVMPMEPTYSMSMPQPYTSQPLLPLAMTSQWTGMMSTQPPSSYTPVPLAPMPPMPSAIGAPQPVHNSQFPTPPTSRKTLTDADRRRMCLYHEENPNVKQTEIGAMFGVERSTVSKVLRQKEKYLSPDDGSRSPIRKPKGKLPDIERALSNWVKKNQREGAQLSDSMIREKALFFASTVGGPDGRQKIMNSNWLAEFKQKNYLPSHASRKGSADTANSLETSSNEHSVAQTPNVLSPDPSARTSPTPISPKQEPDESALASAHTTPKLDSSEFTGGLPQRTNSAGAASRSPSASNPANGLFASENPFDTTGDDADVPNEASNCKRPRSKTLPITNYESSVAPSGTSGDASPKSKSISQTSSVATPAINEASHGVAEPAAMKRNHSYPEIKTTPMQPPPLPKSNTESPVSSPDSPTQDEARKALELVMNYFQHQPSGLVAQDYVTIGKLMERLQLAQSQAAAQRSLQRIDEYPDGPRVCKKRSIHII